MKLISVILGLILTAIPIISTAQANKLCPNLMLIRNSADKLIYIEEGPGSDTYLVATALPTIFFDNTFWYLATIVPAKNKATALIKGRLNVKVTFNQFNKEALDSFGMYNCFYESVAGTKEDPDVVALGIQFENQKLPKLQDIKANLPALK